MKIGIFGKLAFLSLCAWVLSPLAAAQSPVAGDWKGMVVRQGNPVHVILHIAADKDGTLMATLDAIEMNASDVAVSAVVLKDSKLTFSIDAAPGTYEGTLNKDATEITGAWSQGGETVPLNFERDTAPAAASAPVAPPVSVVGDWKGMVITSSNQIHVILHVTADKDGALMATIDAIEMNASDVPVSAVVLKDSKLTYSIDAAPGTYEGTVNKDATEITGTWSQNGESYELDYKRDTTPAAAPAPAAPPAPAAEPAPAAPASPSAPPPAMR